MRRAGAVIAVATLIAALAPATAGAANRRIAISDYAWSTERIQIDLGEHVTWYWVGPDLLHSVTGQPPNAEGLDSDPGTVFPSHEIGDRYQLTFSRPGTYKFICKLHSTVGGTVTVSSTPGDPVSEPDPVPESRVDQTPPRLRSLALGARKFGRRGTSLQFSLGERARVSAEYFRYDSDGRRHFEGYRTWRGYIGFNGVRFGGAGRHFDARPGRYLAVLRAEDRSSNASKPRRLRFRIRERRG